MAASTLSASPSGPSTGKSDEPSFAAPPLFSPMAAPILMPQPASGPPKWIWALLGVGVLAVLGIVVVGVLLLTKKSDPQPPVVAAVTPGVTPVVAPPPAVPGQPPSVNPPPNNGTAQPAVPGVKAEEPKEEKHHKSGGKTKEPKAGAPSSAAPSSTAPAPAAPAAAPKKSGKKDELDDLLNGAAPDKPAPKHSAPKEEPAAGGDSNLPEQLGKNDIVAGMSKVKAKVADCYVQYKVPGMANVGVTIAKNGHVSSASVSGSFAGTPTGSCVEKAVKSATFAPVKGSPTTINYPFMLR